MPKPLLPLSLTVSLWVLAARNGLAAPTPTPSASPAAKPKAAASAQSVNAKTKAKAIPPAQAAIGNQLFRQAITQTQAGKMADAEKTYHQLLKLFPDAAPAWANLGLLAARANRLDEAAADLRKATTLEPKTAPFWAQLSSIELRRKHLTAAETAARKTLALDPQNGYGFANLAGSLMEQGRYDDAIAPLKRLQTFEGGQNPQTLFSLAVALSRANRKKEALPIAKKLTDMSPGQPNFQFMVGDLAAQTGDYVTAHRAYANAYTLVPTDLRAGINAAIASELAGDKSGATAQMEKIVAAHPDSALANFQLGRLYYAQADRASNPSEGFMKAAASFNRAVLQDPKNALYLTNNALALLFAGPDHYDEAEKYFLSALNVAPKTTPAHMGLAYLYERSQKLPKAIEQYQAVLAYEPQQYDPRRRLAGLLYVTGKHAEAYKEFQTLADETPGLKGVIPLKEMASFQINEHHYEDARKSYAAAVARDPRDTDALVGLGQALEGLHETAAAQAKYEAAVAIAPKNPAAYVALGTILENQGKKAEATTVYEKLVAVDPANNSAHWQLAQLYADQKRDEDALRQMHLITIRRSDATHVSYLLAPSNLMMQRGRYADAVADLKALVPQNPSDSAELRYALAVAEDKAGQKDEAEKTLVQLTKEAKKPDEKIRANTTLAQLYEEESRWEDAAHYYEDALAADPSSNTSYVGLWRVRGKLNKPEAAVAYLESLTTADPRGPNLDAAASVRALYQIQQHPEKYTPFAKRIADAYPKNREALNLYANALLQGSAGTPGERDARTQAAEVYRQMTVLNPKDADAFYQRGVLEEALGQKDQAIAAYQGAIAAAGVSADMAAVSSRTALKRLGAPESVATTPAAPAPKPTDPKAIPAGGNPPSSGVNSGKS